MAYHQGDVFLGSVFMRIGAISHSKLNLRYSIPNAK